MTSVSLTHPDPFRHRHIGPDANELAEMLQALGVASLDS